MTAGQKWRSADPNKKLEMLRADMETLGDRVESSSASQRKTDDLLKKIEKAVETIKMSLNALEMRLNALERR